MLTYIMKRLGRGVISVWGVVTLAFILVRLNGSPAVLLLPPQSTPAEVQRLNVALGYNRSVVVQYGHYMVEVLHGNLGNSLQFNVPALGLVLNRLPATLELALSGFLLGTSLALILSILMQLSGKSRIRFVSIGAGTVRQAIPTFLFGILLVLIFSVTLHWLPSEGIGGVKHLILPSIAVGTFELTLYLRLLEAAFGSQEGADYIRTAYAKGQRRTGVVLRHMLPNALLPVLTVVGINLGALLGGAVVIETVFNWPGDGLLLVQAVDARDFPVVQAALLVASVAFVLMNLVVDLTYSAVDPRVRIR
jgi:peptide/nickel transport system permease protein